MPYIIDSNLNRKNIYNLSKLSLMVTENSYEYQPISFTFDNDNYKLPNTFIIHDYLGNDKVKIVFQDKNLEVNNNEYRIKIDFFELI